MDEFQNEDPKTSVRKYTDEPRGCESKFSEEKNDCEGKKFCLIFCILNDHTFIKILS